MPDETKCPECGSPVAQSGPAGGLCPRCLMKAGQGPHADRQRGGTFRPTHP